MNFQEAEKAYKDLQSRHASGALNDAEFEAEVGKLRLQDAQGRWWQIGVQSGAWYVHDGQKWVKSQPPTTPAPAAVPPPTPEGAPPAQPARPSVLPPRLFAAKPPGRSEGGLPPRALVAIIVVVALLGAATIFVGYLVLSGQLKLPGATTVRATATPTVSMAVLPTLPPRPTDTPIVLPTLTPTEVITPTAALTPTRAPARPSPTRVPPTAARPTPTRTIAAPPGVYVTQVQLVPAQPNFNEPIEFRVKLFNNTGQLQRYTWRVKIYQCTSSPCTADDFRRSIGESTTVVSDVVPGTVEVIAPKHWFAGRGACVYVAVPHFISPDGQVVPFLKTDGQPLYHVFNLCR